MRESRILFYFRVFWFDPIKGEVERYTWAQSGIQARSNVRQRCFGNKIEDEIGMALEIELVKGVQPKSDYNWLVSSLRLPELSEPPRSRIKQLVFPGILQPRFPF